MVAQEDQAAFSGSRLCRGDAEDGELSWDAHAREGRSAPQALDEAELQGGRAQKRPTLSGPAFH